MNYHFIGKDKLDSFVRFLAKTRKVYAPTAKGGGAFSFEEVKTAENIALKHTPTILPPKKYFMPQREVVLKMDASTGKEEPVIKGEESVLFGVHTCDIAGIQCLNLAFGETPQDENYLMRRKHIAIIGIECNDYCDKYASCAMMNTFNPDSGYDLMFTELKNGYAVHSATQTGQEFIDGSKLFQKIGDADRKELETLRAQKSAKFKNETGVEKEKLPDIFKKNTKSAVWKEVGEKCLSCANCTNVCPTCYCFDMTDKIELDLKSITRTRVWDSCQTKPFAEVTGGENFREERADRQRHRFSRKFLFPVQKFYRFFCTGCGRCSRTCMAGIDLKETIKSLAKGAL